MLLTLLACFGCEECHVFNMNLITVRVKLNQRIASLDPDPLHTSIQIFKLKVGASFGARVLLIVVIKVNAFVVV